MLARLFLVRHGEVNNPGHLVYADLPGFGLSPIGSAQAAETAGHLSGHTVDVVVSSPIRRAVETAIPLARAVGRHVVVDLALYEWRLSTRWAPTSWDDLPRAFPGELEAYLAHPDDLPFSPESIAEVADRVSALVAVLGDAYAGGTAVLVSHQDPVQAARLRLTGRRLSDLHMDKPEHGSVIELTRRSASWVERTAWQPGARGEPFPPASADGI